MPGERDRFFSGRQCCLKHHKSGVAARSESPLGSLLWDEVNFVQRLDRTPSGPQPFTRLLGGRIKENFFLK